MLGIKKKTFYSDCWREWTRPMVDYKVPYAYALGNHDDEADLSRPEICELDMTSEYSVTQCNPNVTGITNYYLPIYSRNMSNSVPPALVWILDTNDDYCEDLVDSWGCIEKDQIGWYANESKKLT